MRRLYSILIFLSLGMNGCSLPFSSTDSNDLREEVKEAVAEDKDPAPLMDIPYGHFAYIETPVPTAFMPTRYQYQVMAIASDDDWQEFLGKLGLKNRSFPKIDFSSDFLVGIANTYPQARHSLNIERIAMGDRAHIRFLEKIPAPDCATEISLEPYHFFHFVRVSRTEAKDNPFQRDENPTAVGLGAISSCNAQYFSQEQLQEQRKLPFEVFVQNDQAELVANDVFISPIAGKWGEWDLFLARQCPDCKYTEVPDGYPAHYYLLALVDNKPGVERRGNAQLKIAGLYQRENEVLIDLVREVDLCAKSQLNQPFIVAQIPHGAVKGSEPFIKRSFKLASPFIREEQKRCTEEPADDE